MNYKTCQSCHQIFIGHLECPFCKEDREDLAAAEKALKDGNFVSFEELKKELDI